MGRVNVWLLLVVALCALSYWFGKDLIPEREDKAERNEPSSGSVPSFAMSDEDTPIHLSVLNGTQEDGLARKISLLLGRAGCVAENVGNAPDRQLGNSLLVNRKLSDARASALARRLGGIRVIREWDGRGSEDAVLVLGLDFADLEAGLAQNGSSEGR